MLRRVLREETPLNVTDERKRNGEKPQGSVLALPSLTEGYIPMLRLSQPSGHSYAAQCPHVQQEQVFAGPVFAFCGHWWCKISNSLSTI